MTLSSKFVFNPNGDYKNEFKAYVDVLIHKDTVIEDRYERMTVIEKVIDDYIEAVGERPDNKELARLTHCILREELKDTHPYKKLKEEFSIMSSSQITRRKTTEAVLDYAENHLGSDGRNHKKPSRNTTNYSEV